MPIPSTQILTFNDPLIQIALLILVFAIAWAILGFLSRVLRRVLRAGCTLVILVAVFVLVARYFI